MKRIAMALVRRTAIAVVMTVLMFNCSVRGSFYVAAQSTSAGREPRASLDLGDLSASQSEMRGLLERYATDRASLNRFYSIPFSESRRTRFRQFYSDWLGQLPKLAFDTMSVAGRVDYLLFSNHLNYELAQLDMQAKQLAEIEPVFPLVHHHAHSPAKAASSLRSLARALESCAFEVPS